MDYKQLLNSTPEAALRPGMMYKSLLSSGNRTIDDLHLDKKSRQFGKTIPTAVVWPISG